MCLESGGGFRWTVKDRKINSRPSCKIDNIYKNKEEKLEMEKARRHKMVPNFLKVKNSTQFSSRLDSSRNLSTKSVKDFKRTSWTLSHSPYTWLKRSIPKIINTNICSKIIATLITATYPIEENPIVHTTGGNPMKGATHSWKTLLLSNNLP